MEGDRYRRGWETLKLVNREAAEAQADSLADIAPDLQRFVVEFGFGDIVSRPGLALRDRELMTVVALTVLGNARPQLVAHIGGALNVGVTPREIVEAIMQMALYAGFPAALNAMQAAREVFALRGVSPEEGVSESQLAFPRP